MKLKAKKAFRYAGKALSVGDRFETRGDLDARLLIAIGKAEIVRERAPKSAAQAPVIAASPIETVTPESVVVDHSYMRRDMTASE